MKILCYYHDDADGIVSAMIVKKFHKSFITFVPCQYGSNVDVILKKEDSLDNHDMCYVIDYSFDKATMKALYDSYGDKLVWIDHHKTAIDKVEELETMITGVRDITICGALLTWKYLFNEAIVPQYVEYTNDYDMWEFKFGDDTRAFGEGFNANISHPTNEYAFALSNGEIDESILRDHGYALLNAKHKRVTKSFMEGNDGTFEGHKCRFINTNHDMSMVGEMAYKEYNYPVALMYSIREGKVIINLRSSTIDVSEFAKKYGGGGHKYAAGFTASLKDFFESIYNQVGV